jgi:hypothetical protein
MMNAEPKRVVDDDEFAASFVLSRSDVQSALAGPADECGDESPWDQALRALRLRRRAAFAVTAVLTLALALLFYFAAP